MKLFRSRILLPLLLLGLPVAMMAQAQFALVLPDSSGKPMAAHPASLLVELTTGDIKGQAQYAETHSVVTSPEGLASFVIGTGQPTDPKYVFDNFDVAQGTNFLRVSVKEAGGNRLVLSSQIPNVPKVQRWLFAADKHNTVIAVMVVAWLGIVVYLLLANRKMAKLEKRIAALKQQGSSES